MSTYGSDARVLAEELDELVVERLGIEVEEAHPAHARHVGRRARHERRASVAAARPSRSRP